jgi:hypothetical protein
MAASELDYVIAHLCRAVLILPEPLEPIGCQCGIAYPYGEGRLVGDRDL